VRRPDEDDGDLDAGDFSAWLGSVLGAIRDREPSAVPCAGCTACCTSSQFVHIEPDEVDVLAHIPAALLFPAPGRPHGHVLLGFDERGHCPMLVEGGCSIYEHRPRTCRSYDCRVFAASGIEPGEAQVAIARRARRWRFRAPDADARAELAAVESAGRTLDERRTGLGPTPVPADPTQLAVLAVDVSGVFLERDEAGALTVVDPGLDVLADAVARARRRT
jgi:uncharacterized protein